MVPIGSPLLTQRGLVAGGRVSSAGPGEAVATRAGALRATSICVVLFALAFGAIWALFYPALTEGDAAVIDAVRNAAFAGGVLMFSLAFATYLRPRAAVATAPITAIAGGIFAGGLALAIEQRFPGIALNSIALTLLVFIVLLGGYTSGTIQVTARYRAVVFAATTVVAAAYLLSFGLWVVDLQLPVIHGAGWGGVLWTGFVALVASLNLTVDFARIDGLEKRRYPPYMAWYVALGTIVTFAWLYVTILRMLRRLRVAGG